MGLRLLDGTGGSTKGIGIFYAWKTALEKGFIPDMISGISISNLMMVPFALGKYAELEKLFDEFTIDYIFEKSPVNKKGGITPRAIFRAVTGKSLGKMTPLYDILTELVTKADFMKYKSRHEYVPCYSMSVDFKTGKRVFVNMKNVSYEEYIKYSIASASIPVFTEPVCINGMLLYDGGVRDHGIAHWMIENFDISEVFSVWSRPANYDISDPSWKDKNIIEVILRNTDIMMMENSKNDEYKMYQVCGEKNVDLKTVFLPNILKDLYDTDRARLNQLGQAGVARTKKVFSNLEVVI